MGFKAFCKRTGAVIYKHRADIEFAAGLGLVVTGTVLLIKDSEKIATAIADHDSRARLIDDVDAAGADDPDAGWTDEDERKEFIKNDIKTTLKDFGKTVGKDVAFIVAGEGIQYLAHVDLKKQLINMTFVAANASAAFANLKQKIVEDQGQEKLDEYLYGPCIKTVVVDEDGNVIEKTEYIKDENGKVGLPPHCFFFDESQLFSKSRGVNKNTVEDLQFWIDQRLEKEGFLWKNDILRDFKVPLTCDGWTSGIMAYDENGNRNHISFGFEKPDAATQRFLDGIEDNVIIKLNLEDNITSKLKLRLK